MTPDTDALADLDDVLEDPRIDVVDYRARCVACGSDIVATSAVGIAAHRIREHLTRWCALLP